MRTPLKKIRFLNTQNALEIHADAIEKEGGSPGLRDIALLESALAMPYATYDGHYLHDGLAAMAAAYLFHICQNHAFVDGNKRAAASATLQFLRSNGVAFAALPDPEELKRVMLAVASGQMSKSEITEWLRTLYPK